MLRKLIVTTVGFTANSLLYAGAMGPVCTPGDVTVPCIAQVWEFGIQALYLKPSFSTQNSVSSAISLFTTLFAPRPTRVLLPQFQQFNNDWSWGSRLWGAYHFNTGNDIAVSWLHFRGSDNHVWNALVPEIGLIPDTNVLNTPFHRPARNRTVTVDLGIQDRLDQVNVVLGQEADFTVLKRLRFYAGLQYAHVQVNASSKFTPNFRILPTLAPTRAIPGNAYNNTVFQGSGPLAGIDYAYNITEAFSLTANAAVSVLLGTNRYLAGLINIHGIAITSVGRHFGPIVPSLEARLGVNYAYNMAQGQLNAQLGFQSLNYFNILRSQPSGPSGLMQLSDYGLYGPYVGLTYLGNA